MKRRLKPFLVIAIPAAVVLLAISLPFNPKKEEDSSSSFTTTSQEETEGEPFIFSPFGKKEVSQQEEGASDVAAETSLDRLYPDLPIYIESNETSVGITTTINIYRTVMDPWNLIRLEIYGPDYHHPVIDKDDPNMVAFKETFLKAKDILSAKGINLSELNIEYSTVPYVRDVAEFWVENLYLL